MFCHLSSFTCAQVWSSPCAQCVLWRGGCWWWTSAVFQIVIQLLKTSCPVLPVPCQVWWWCCSASPGPLNADTLSKNTVLLWRWELPLPAVFRQLSEVVGCLWECCWGGNGGHGDLCSGPSYMAPWPPGKQGLQEQPRWMAPWLWAFSVRAQVWSKGLFWNLLALEPWKVSSHRFFPPFKNLESLKTPVLHKKFCFSWDQLTTPSSFKQKSLWGIFYLRIWQCFPHLLILVSTAKKKSGTAGSCWPLRLSQWKAWHRACSCVLLSASGCHPWKSLRRKLKGDLGGGCVWFFSVVVWEQL